MRQRAPLWSIQTVKLYMLLFLYSLLKVAAVLLVSTQRLAIHMFCAVNIDECRGALVICVACVGYDNRQFKIDQRN